MPVEVKKESSEIIIRITEKDMPKVMHESLNCVNGILFEKPQRSSAGPNTPVKLDLHSSNNSELLREFLNECLYLSNVNKQLYRLKLIGDLSENYFNGEIEPYYKLNEDEQFSEEFSFILLKQEIATEGDAVIAEICLQSSL